MTKGGAVRKGLRGDQLHQALSIKLESPRGGDLGSRGPCRSPRSAGAWGSCRFGRRLGVRAAPPRGLLADVALHGPRVARVRAVRVVAEFALGAPLAQQVPALVQLLD